MELLKKGENSHSQHHIFFAGYYQLYCSARNTWRPFLHFHCWPSSVQRKDLPIHQSTSLTIFSLIIKTRKSCSPKARIRKQMVGIKARKTRPRLHAISDGKELWRVPKRSVPLLQQLWLYNPKGIRRLFHLRTRTPRQKQAKEDQSLGKKPTFLPLRP